MLARIRRVKFPLSVLGRSHGRTMPMTRAVVDWRLRRTPVSRLEASHYRRAVAEMVRSFRAATGEPLTAALQLTLRKWTNHGLDPRLLQDLCCDVFDKFEAAGRLPPKQRDVMPAKRAPRKRRRTYQQAVERGWATLRPGQTPAEQATHFARAVSTNQDISRKLASLLKERGVPGKQFIRYNAFGQKLGRLSRRFSSGTLARAAADLVDLYEAKSLDHETLLAICADLFGLTALPA
jgi:hypothetical protein